MQSLVTSLTWLEKLYRRNEMPRRNEMQLMKDAECSHKRQTQLVIGAHLRLEMKYSTRIADPSTK